MKKSILFLVLALVIFSLSMSFSTKTEPYDQACGDIFTLECDLVAAMKAKYEGTQLDLIDETLKLEDEKGDAQAAWLSLKDLKDFICQIEARTTELPRDLGIRIYYTAYPKYGEWHKYPELTDALSRGEIKESYAERHTVVLVPTLSRQNQVQDLNLSGQGGMLALTPGIGITKKPGKNHGSLFPPDPLLWRSCD